jgi:hypothetical protein
MTGHRLIVKEVRTGALIENVTNGIIFSKRGLPHTEQPIERDKGVYLRERLANIAFISLNHTSSDEKTSQTSGLLKLGELQYTINALFDRAFKEATGVYDSDVGTTQVVHDFETGVTQDTDHDLRVYLIFSAAKGHDRGTTSEPLSLTRVGLGYVNGNRTALSRLVSERKDGQSSGLHSV